MRLISHWRHIEEAEKRCQNLGAQFFEVVVVESEEVGEF